MERFHSIRIELEQGDMPLPVLVRFLDPARSPRRTLAVLLEQPQFEVRGFLLRGDETPEVICARPDARVRVTVERRSTAYQLARRAAEALVPLHSPSPSASPIAHTKTEPLRALPANTTILIPTRDRVDLLEPAIRSLFGTVRWPGLDLIIIDNGSERPETIAFLQRAAERENIRVLRRDAPFNFAWLNNEGAKLARGEILAFLNNDIEALTSGWLSPLAALACDPQVGAVGAKLLYPDRTVQHAGITLGVNGLAGHSGRGATADAPGPHNLLTTTRQVAAVTGACLVTRRDVFERLGGFNEAFVVEFNDIDYCLRAADLGLKTMWTPDSVLIHKEGSSRGHNKRPSLQVMQDQALFIRTWGPRLVHDPWFPSDLSRQTETLTG